jgi:hypothetical protein
MRFLQQRDSYSCGPIAIINLFKWCGMRAGKKDIPLFRRMLGTNIPFGTKQGSMSRLLKHTIDRRIAKVKLVKHISFGELKKAMKAGACAIAHWTYLIDGKYEGHYAFMAERTSSGTWVVANEVPGELFFSDKEIQKRIRTSKRLAPHWETLGRTSPFCWLITPKKGKQ